MPIILDGTLNAIQSQSGNNVFQFDSFGRVLTPQRPAFYANGATNNCWNSNNYWVFPTTRVNVGGHYNPSTGRFTAPIAGNYAFWWGNIGGTPGSSVYRFYFRVNGNSIGDVHHRIDNTASGSEYTGNAAARFFMYPLNVGDYVQIYYYSDDNSVAYPGSNDGANDYPYFAGMLT